ncbi:MAG: DUF481 domain-containing protein [Flavobacteriales bacterium]
MRSIILLFCLVIGIHTISLNAQTLSSDHFPNKNDTLKWTGNLNVNFNMVKNANRLLQINSRLNTKYQTQKHQFIFVNSFHFKEANSTELIHKGITQLNFTSRKNNRFNYEIFNHLQFNEIIYLKFRNVFGIGFRNRIYKSKKLVLNTGLAPMFEYAYFNKNNEKVFERNTRVNTYLSMVYFPHPQITINSSTYFQPKINTIQNFRISNETRLTFKVTKNIGFNIHLMIWQDAFNRYGINQIQYKLNSGMTLML